MVSGGGIPDTFFFQQNFLIMIFLFKKEEQEPSFKQIKVKQTRFFKVFQNFEKWLKNDLIFIEPSDLLIYLKTENENFIFALNTEEGVQLSIDKELFNIINYAVVL